MDLLNQGIASIKILTVVVAKCIDKLFKKCRSKAVIVLIDKDFYRFMQNHPLNNDGIFLISYVEVIKRP